MSEDQAHPTLQYETITADAGAEAVARVSDVMAGVFAFGGVLDILVLAGDVARRGPIGLLLGLSRPLDQVDLLLRTLVAATALLVGARLIRRRPYRRSVLIGSALLAAARVVALAAVLSLIWRNSFPSSTLRYVILQQSAATLTLLMLPLANLVWFTRPAVKRYHAYLSGRWERH